MSFHAVDVPALRSKSVSSKPISIVLTGDQVVSAATEIRDFHRKGVLSVVAEDGQSVDVLAFLNAVAPEIFPPAASQTPAVSPAGIKREDAVATDAGNPEPTLFISYSYDSDNHKDWVRKLAEDLHAAGVKVLLDQWSLRPGFDLPQFMETSIRASSQVLLVCTPTFADKANGGHGGVGYEKNVITGEILTRKPTIAGKFVPALRSGTSATSIPSYAQSMLYIDFRDDATYAKSVDQLLRHVHDEPEYRAPPVGKKPNFSSSKQVDRTPAPSASLIDDDDDDDDDDNDDDRTIGLLGVIAEEVGSPRNDGTRGSALYAVPFRLSRAPSAEWEDIFLASWARPREWTSMHRHDIAEVDGDKVILTRTTVDEVKQYHLRTLKIAIEMANSELTRIHRERADRKSAERNARDAHRASVQASLKNLKV